MTRSLYVSNSHLSQRPTASKAGDTVRHFKQEGTRVTRRCLGQQRQDEGQGRISELQDELCGMIDEELDIGELGRPLP
jgi:hypothetical protein